MAEPIWRGPVEMRWDNNCLMIGKLCVGVVVEMCAAPRWLCLLSLDAGAYDGIGEHPTEPEARSALYEAAVRALSGSDG